MANKNKLPEKIFCVKGLRPNSTEKEIDIGLFTDLEKVVGDYVKFRFSDDYHEDNDYKAYIFEAAVQAFYGEGIWQKFKEAELERKIRAKKKELKELKGR